MMNFRKLTAMALFSAALVIAVALPAAADKNDKKEAAAPAAASGASAPAASGGYKIGVVDIEQVIEGYPKKQRLMQELQTKVDSEQTGIDTMTTKLESLQKAFESGKDKLTDAEKSAKAGEIRELITNIKAEREKKQGAIDQREAEIKQEVFGDVTKAIQQIAESENYHLVLNARSLPNASVLYASPTIDISGKVSAQLGK